MLPSWLPYTLRSPGSLRICRGALPKRMLFGKRRKLSTSALLAFPIPGNSFLLTTDASSVAIGAVLEQVIHGLPRPLGFFSRRLLKAERNYSTFDRELLAVHQAVRHFRHFLEGNTFTIQTDHMPSPNEQTRGPFASAGLSHPSQRATARLLKQKFVWHNICKDAREWVRSCVACQTSKIQRHTETGPRILPSVAETFRPHPRRCGGSPATIRGSSLSLHCGGPFDSMA